ncbi:putative permease [compost metagenome]
MVEHQQQHRKGNKIFAVLEHSGSEFFEMGKYLMLGSVITAAIQTFVPRTELIDIGQVPMVSHVFMMGFAYILSICSTADAFVAASFVNSFSAGSLLTFLVFGPMLDFKSTLMLLSVFKTRFVLKLSFLVITVVLIGSLLVEHFYFGY